MSKKKLLTLVTLFSFGMASLSSSAVLDKEFKGITYTSYTKDGYCSPESDQKIKNLNTTGANYVAFVTTFYQDNLSSNEIDMWPNKTMDFICLNQAITELRKGSIKQEVLFKPHIDVPGSTSWRGFFNPSDKFLWFASYERVIVTCAIVAEYVGAEMFCIGTELVSLTKPEYATYWNRIIAEVRKVYSGKIVYAANFEELSQITFWEDLDVIGVEAYFTLTTKKNPTPMELLAGWKNVTGRVFNVLPKTNKPVIFTEVGFRSIDGANIDPEDWSINGIIDLQEQADCYEATILSLLTDPRISGLFFWSWSLESDTKKIDYTPEGKPAEKIMTDWFKGLATNPMRGIDVWVAESIQKTTKEFSFVVGNDADFKGKQCASVDISFETNSQSQTNWNLNKVVIQILRGDAVIIDYTDEYQSESITGSIPPVLHKHSFSYPGFVSGEKLTIKITVSTGDYRNWVSQFAIISNWK
ncbi:MAG: hypothetical protein WCK16_03475 [Candidatus Moraniibacteriota bacterium]